MSELAGRLADDVKIEAALALGCARIASEGPGEIWRPGHTDATGPKISSRAIVIAGSTRIENRRAEEEARPRPRRRRRSSVEHEPGALRNPSLDVTEHPLAMTAADDRAHLRSRDPCRRRPGGDGPTRPAGRALRCGPSRPAPERCPRGTSPRASVERLRDRSRSHGRDRRPASRRRNSSLLRGPARVCRRACRAR